MRLRDCHEMRYDLKNVVYNEKYRALFLLDNNIETIENCWNREVTIVGHSKEVIFKYVSFFSREIEDDLQKKLHIIFPDCGYYRTWKFYNAESSMALFVCSDYDKLLDQNRNGKEIAPLTMERLWKFK